LGKEEKRPRKEKDLFPDRGIRIDEKTVKREKIGPIQGWKRG